MQFSSVFVENGYNVKIVGQEDNFLGGNFGVSLENMFDGMLFFTQLEYLSEVFNLSKAMAAASPTKAVAATAQKKNPKKMVEFCIVRFRWKFGIM